MRKLIIQIIAGVLGLWLAVRFIPGIEFQGPLRVLLLAGAILGLFNFFIKPVLKIITLPLRILTFGLFSLAINMGIIWIVDIIFLELNIVKLLPLFLTTLLVWFLSLVLPIFIPKN